MMDRSKRRRPAFGNLLQIQMPVGAVASILHPATGIVLALAIPFSAYLLDLSLQGPQTFAQVIGLFDQWVIRIGVVASAWALAHHSLAGIRHLLSDIDVGLQLPAARSSA